MKDLIVSILNAAIERARAAGQLKTAPPAAASVEAPKDPAHGDAASNVALVMARAEKKPPRAIAEIIRANLELPPEVAESSIAGAGFINFRMAPAFWHRRDAPRRGAKASASGARRSARAARSRSSFSRPIRPGRSPSATGATRCWATRSPRMHEATGFKVTREYYFNNGGRQMRLLGESVRARYLEELGRRGDDARGRLPGRIHPRYRARPGCAPRRARWPTRPIWKFFAQPAENAIFADIRHTCERLGIHFDVYTNELDLIRGGQVDAVIEGLRERGLIAEYDGAVWLQGRAAGAAQGSRCWCARGRQREPTYRTPDIAYHIEKLRRGFDLHDRRFRRRPYRRA